MLDAGTAVGATCVPAFHEQKSCDHGTREWVPARSLGFVALPIPRLASLLLAGPWGRNPLGKGTYDRDAL
jgi:hypothetical protein